VRGDDEDHRIHHGIGRREPVIGQSFRGFSRRLTGPTGRIRPNFLADIVGVAGDPTVNVQVVRHALRNEGWNYLQTTLGNRKKRFILFVPREG
jgi:hypothetical protein